MRKRSLRNSASLNAADRICTLAMSRLEDLARSDSKLPIGSCMLILTPGYGAHPNVIFLML
jgi:hypothetical protein